ncbi:HlyD family type I secretion periplasmic adaptor subunit [Oceanicella sp. SM1341]|uniref:HlyD family type I secretion periplasmic adaptor subunit n=1 Tax=Oceanicella sp. SM1341 TaxID=1548889 RepID=UPI0018E5057B|nr:HlyD family type I secretion periplasmic adaptor subunit [Oceanicella sp. SM1341]
MSAPPPAVPPAAAPPPALRGRPRRRSLLARLLPRGAGAAEVQLRHLSKSVRLEETTDPGLTRLVIWTVAAVCAALLWWAGATRIPEVAVASGQVEPYGYERRIQHRTGGTLDAILVRPGEAVSRGQLLARLDGDPLRKELDRTRQRIRFLSIKAERLAAYTEGRPADFAGIAPEDAPEIREARATLDAMRRALGDQQQVAGFERDRVEQEIAVISAQRAGFERDLARAENLLVRRRELFDKGVITFGRLEEAEGRVDRLRSELEVLEERLVQARSSLDEFTSRRETVDSGDLSAALQQLVEVRDELEDARILEAKLTDELEELDIRAPLDGVVKGVESLTAGMILQPGATLLQIVPRGERMVVRVRIDPRDVGRLGHGMKAQVNVTAYDFVRFGSVNGELVFVSASSFTSPEGRAYFAGEIRLAQDHVGPDPAMNPISPGMTVRANIINGERTFLAYLFKPVRLALAEAFGEH